MNLVICWSHLSGYMSACWRALARSSDVNLSVLAWHGDRGTDSKFQPDVAAGFDCRLLDESERSNVELLVDHILQRHADVVVLAGWSHAAYRKVAAHSRLSNVRFALAMDTSGKPFLRRMLVRHYLRSYLNRMSMLIVSGERSWQYARSLGVPESKIRRGMYGYDDALYSSIAEQRAARNAGSDWPKQFLYIGRYVPDKAIDVLLAAHKKYRAISTDCWPLVCAGTGPLGALIDAAARDADDSIRNLGFVAPGAQAELFLASGCALLPSRYEPWGVSIAECAAAGLPIICSAACGASVELVRAQHSGLIVPTNDVDALVMAMLRIERMGADRLQQMGQHGQSLAEAYGAANWAVRWEAYLREMV